MSHWRLAAGTRWLVHTTVTERGAQTVQTNLTGGDEHGLTPAAELLYPLRRAVL
jgi:hypothetical protein